MSDLEFSNRRFLVTGASSGVGRAVGVAASRLGATVAWLSRRTERLEEAVKAHGGVAVPVDLSDLHGIHAAVDRSASFLGGIDVVVNAAGIARHGRIGDADPTDALEVFTVNVLAPIEIMRVSLPYLHRSANGHVLSVGSLSAHRISHPDTTVYSASKAALRTATMGLRQQLAGSGIRVGIVSTGTIRSGFADSFPPERKRAAEDRQLRIGLEPEVIAEAILDHLRHPVPAQLAESIIAHADDQW